MSARGILVVISAPSGGGKTTILRKVLESADDNFRYSISVTTRPKRTGEVDGRDYYFTSLNEFERQRERGEFVEWAEVHGHYYATPRKPIERWLSEGRIVLTDLDVYGGLQVKQHFGDSALLIFVRPPSYDSLLERLRRRNTESREEIEKRLTRYPDEMQKSEQYDHVCVNDDIDTTTRKIIELINNHYTRS